MNRCKGYTLVEIAIVLVIVALLVPTLSMAFLKWKERAEDLADRPVAQEEYNELLYEMKTGKPCPKKGLTAGSGKKVGLLKHCPDTEE